MSEETMNQNTEQKPTNSNPDKNGDPGSGRTFTQEEVNRIVADRLAKERAKASKSVDPETDHREQELTAREQILDDLQTFIEDGEHTVLLSTHITSDLDRVADNILILSHGKMRVDVEKDTLLNEYIVLKGSPEQLGQMQPEDILGVKKQAYSFEALCVGRERMQEKYPQFVCDSADIEQILILLEGGADQ